MIRWVMVILSLAILLPVSAEQPVGYLWYNLPKHEDQKKSPSKIKGVPFSQLSYQAQDAVLAYYTREAWHKAMIKGSVESMKNYLALQDYWTTRATKVSRLFEKTLLYYPEYRYETTHPTSSIGTQLSDSLLLKKQESTIRQMAKDHGLLYFYRGKNPYDEKEAGIIKDFAQRFDLSLIPISVDRVTDPNLPGSQIDKGQAKALNIRFYPALLMANPKTHKVMPISYGLITQDMLARQFLLVATNFSKGTL